MAVEAESLSPANLSAARQHVRTLSTREREALLRALLEQQESPQTSEKQHARPRHTASASSLSASASASGLSSVFDCPSLPEETEDDAGTALSPPPAHAQVHPRRSVSSSMSSLSTSTSWPTRSASTSAVAARQSPRQPLLHTRSHSTSHATVRSSLSAKSNQNNRNTADSVDLFHYRSKSYSASLERDSTEQPAAAAEPRTWPEGSADTVLHSGLNIVTPANTDILQGPATVENSPRGAKTAIAYWCTSCGDQFSRRSVWAAHDVTCRATGRHRARSKHHARPQRAWACGFCAAFLGSVERYQDHVTGHFERGKGLADWHYANVIYGLLHQPLVHKAWKRTWAARAAALPAGQRPKATWPSDCKFPTKRLDTPDTRDSNHKGDTVYIGLQEALESFDAAVESASVIVLHAESLAIFISVPIEQSSSKARNDRGSAHRSRSIGDRDRPERDASATRLRSRSRPTREEVGVHRATSTTITSISKLRTQNAEKASTTTAAPTSAPASPPNARSKDDPLPALPLFATLTASLSPPAASTSTSTNTSTGSGSGKPRRTSVKTTALKPLNLFRSKETEAGGNGKEKEKAGNKAVSASAGSPPNATTYRSTYWADRPLPPLAMDASLASASASPSSSPDTQAQLVAADHYTLVSPSASGTPHTKDIKDKAKADMDRIGTSFVDDFIMSISAKRAVRG